ncbi:hypothetical protein DDE01_12460 [Desulfovibrio desulfuricans]|nr:hypothetical protein DDE01_12460 [Desulfovibrio desulfuricans]
MSGTVWGLSDIAVTGDAFIPVVLHRIRRNIRRNVRPVIKPDGGPKAHDRTHGFPVRRLQLPAADRAGGIAATGKVTQGKWPFGYDGPPRHRRTRSGGKVQQAIQRVIDLDGECFSSKVIHRGARPEVMHIAPFRCHASIMRET